MRAQGPSRRFVVIAFGLTGLVLVGFMLFGNHFLAEGHNKSDEAHYLYFARNLTHGKYAVAAKQADGYYLWHSPGLPLALAPLVAVHAPIHVLRLVGPVAMLLAGIFFWLLLRRWISPWLALAGGLALSLFPPFLRMLPQLFSEPLALMFLVAALLALAKAYESGTWPWAAASGVLGGLMVLTRLDQGWILLAGLVLTAIVAVWRRRRTDVLNLICVAAATLVCMPWLIYTASLAHKFPYWTASGGESLYWMASTTPGTDGSWESPERALSDPRFAADRPLFARLAPLPQVKRDSELTSAALTLVRRHPGVYLRHVVDNGGRMILDIPYSFTATGKGFLLYGVFDVALLLAVVAAIVVLRRRPPPRIPPLLGFMIVFAVLNLVLHVLVAAYPRMTTLSIPAALALVAVGLDQALRERAGRRPAAQAMPAPA
jgi:4-amino-4-deoxy-L-arabinose transferase-like glycosyltransferase